MSYTPRTAPDHELTGWPSGVKYIIGNEGAERFSFYGMKAILYIYLTTLIQASGVAEKMAEAEATANVHLFIAGVYAFPVLGAILADKLLGKYYTIISLSLVYCLGHALMAVFDGNLSGTYAGLACIAVGSGGIKPCVSAHVGDQFGKKNWRLLVRVFQAFYFIINFGSFFSTLLVPVLYAKYNAMIAFGVPGVLMFLATWMFWLGRKDFVHIPANPGGKLGLLDTLVGFSFFVPLAMWLFAADFGLTSLWLRLAIAFGGVALGLVIFGYRQSQEEDDGFLAVLVYSIKALFKKPDLAPAKVHADEGEGVLQREASADDIRTHWFFGAAARKYGTEAAEGPRAVLRIVSVFILVSFFWMLFDQHSSTWIEQAKQMDRNLGFWNPLPSQVSSVNPILVMLLIPLLAFGVFPLFERFGIRITPLRKMSVGMLLAETAFVAVALIQSRIEAEGFKTIPMPAELASLTPYILVGKVSVAWQLVPYILMTLSEVLVSITGLEFAYSQAPKRMKSIVMSFWLLCVSIGNWLVAKLAHAWADWELSEAFWYFAYMMFIAGALFTVRALFYQYKDYPQ